tara:strand:- start:4307 stop:4522 length:216 start_codon:yes stop_codon:yes gene_type:complete
VYTAETLYFDAYKLSFTFALCTKVTRGFSLLLEVSSKRKKGKDQGKISKTDIGHILRVKIYLFLYHIKTGD